MKVELEKLESHKEVVVKALLDNRTTGLFIDTAFNKKKGFKIEKLKKPLLVRHIDETINVGGAITHQVECNMFSKGHVERVRIDIYNLGKMEVILGMLWLAAHNPEIDWEKEKVKMTQCLPIYGKRKQDTEKREVKRAEKGKGFRSTKKASAKEILEVEKSVWKERVRINTSAKGLGSCHRVKRKVH